MPEASVVNTKLDVVIPAAVPAAPTCLPVVSK